MEQTDPEYVRKGYTLVYTGDGKGKTTAAIGLAVRAAGQGFKVLILQFIKSSGRICGEHIALRKLGVDIRSLGAGFTRTGSPELHRAALKEAWRTARDEVMGGGWDVVVLDEINNALAISRFPVDDVLPTAEVLELIASKPSHVHLVLTGREAKPEVMEAAELVTVMQPVKHYYRDGVPAIPGIEF
ncbi:cob(I)yrinic acid a,c-diamide adenosyltransferase [Paenibacillus sp. HN-1]|uniref:cob(I)yrinic acid a,c-diamide adenosyltransferase n=1 Tax=Paenibacillus TaxID=44249 RepID=UPI001CA8FF7D|nr:MULTISPECIES: cob(I)yrinic acid a,c-diamide adenosyltransferase [Paenibacillus]MBY9078149.1 cob(I)yrinic acid a,c-diamide adenosyltransferase [Paenibacillus sp. CGMCC 1.18879]MBY9083890.1 cob(I)yrinic acid a,c-diamide adenosyltransferase [Paenibacillus sinensis]